MRNLIGKIDKIIDSDHGFIIDEDGKQYLFTRFDIIDDMEIEKGMLVDFKPLSDNKILRATYISKHE